MIVLTRDYYVMSSRDHQYLFHPRRRTAQRDNEVSDSISDLTMSSKGGGSRYIGYWVFSECSLYSVGESHRIEILSTEVFPRQTTLKKGFSNFEIQK